MGVQIKTILADFSMNLYGIWQKRFQQFIVIVSTTTFFVIQHNSGYAQQAPPVVDAAKPSFPALPRVDRRPISDSGRLFLVPPLMDRPLGVDEGERLIVRSFALRGVVDRPEYGLMIRDVEAVLESKRLQKQQLQGELVEGFTPGALMESARILRELVDRRERGEDTEEDKQKIQELIQKLKDVEYNQGLTIGQLQEIVDEVTTYYRKKGFVLAQAYIPAQTITNGVVIVQVLEGTLEHIVVENNKHYSTELITESFTDLIGLPVVKTPMESALLRLTDYPGLNAYGVFRPGKNIGSTELVINTQEERAGNLAFYLDNHGSEFTGEYRARIAYALNNPTNSRDRLFGDIYQTFDPANGTYGSMAYERPLFSLTSTIGIQYNQNTYDFETEGGFLPGDGETRVGGIYWRYSMDRSREKNSHVLLDFSRKRADVSLKEKGNGNGTLIEFRDDLAVLALEYGFDSIGIKTTGVNIGSIRYSHGFDDAFGIPADDPESSDNSLNTGSTAKFDKVHLAYTRLQSIDAKNSVLFNFRGQYSDDILVSLEQFPLGGPDSIRAYPVSKYLRDKAYFTSLEWMIKAPGISEDEALQNKTWGEIMQLSLFFDAAGGRNNTEGDKDADSIDIMGIGVGFRIHYKSFNARLDFAKPINKDESEDIEDSQFYFTTSYNF